MFRISSSGQLTTLHSFDGTDGTAPFEGYKGLFEGTDGNFYGTTPNGGDISCFASGGAGCGTLFNITLGGIVAIMHTMVLSDGANSASNLLQHTSGVFYGTGQDGGSSSCDNGLGCGTIYSLNTGLGAFVTFVRGGASAGQGFGILGQGFTGTTNVSMSGLSARFTVVSDTLIKAKVPAGATSGYVTVTTPSATLTSNVPFRVIQ